MKCIKIYLHKTQFICERYQVSELSVWESPPLPHSASTEVQNAVSWWKFLVRLRGNLGNLWIQPQNTRGFATSLCVAIAKRRDGHQKKRVQPSKKIMASTGLLTDSDFSQIWIFAGDVVSFGGWDPVHITKNMWIWCQGNRCRHAHGNKELRSFRPEVPWVNKSTFFSM